MFKLSINKKTLVSNILCCISIFMFAFCPTSSETIIYGLGRTLFIWSVAAIVVLLFVLSGKVNGARLVLSFCFCMIYMIAVTLIAQQQFGSYHESLARIAPLIVLILLFESEVNEFPNFKLELVLINLFSICCILWNCGILLRIPAVQQFTYNNYNQYYDLALFYSVMQNAKPVMSFGVHTYASYFYFFFFILSYYTYEVTEKRRYLVYCVAYIGFTVFLVSTTALFFSIAMFTFLSYHLIKRNDRKDFIALLVFLSISLLVLYKNFDFLIDKIYINMTNGQNSFVSRYAKGSVFTENIKVITSSLGIGFNILDDVNLGYSDSGYVVYLTMGNIPLMIYVYYNLFALFKRNIPKKFLTIVMVIIFSFEAALPASFQQRFPFLVIFIIGYLQSLAAEENRRGINNEINILTGTNADRK